MKNEPMASERVGEGGFGRRRRKGQRAVDVYARLAGTDSAPKAARVERTRLGGRNGQRLAVPSG